MGKRKKEKLNPQSLVESVVAQITKIGILDRNKYVRGLAGQLEEAGKDEGARGLAGKGNGNPNYRARIVLRVLNYKIIGELEQFLEEHKGEFNGDCSLRMHPVDPLIDSKIRVISINEPYGKPSEQERALIDDLKTLGNIFDNYAQQRR
jgi:hypothetical protein